MTGSKHLITLQQQLSESFGQHLVVNDTDELSEQLAVIINYLILNDMNRLWFILYRVDIEEETVLKIMRDNSIEMASQLIAGALINRQLQKIESRKNNSASTDIPEGEKW